MPLKSTCTSTLTDDLFSIHLPVKARDQTIFSLTFKQRSIVMKDLLHATSCIVVSLPDAAFVFLLEQNRSWLIYEKFINDVVNTENVKEILTTGGWAHL